MASSRAAWRGILVLAMISALVGCSRRPRTLDEIAAEQMSLPVLYLTADGEEVIAPARSDRDVIVVPRSRKLAFRAYVCTNPACPNRDRQQNGRPFLFSWPDPMWRVDEQGELQYDVVEDRMAEILRRGGTEEPTCPGCQPRRDPARETAEQRQRYRDWVVYYELPESIARNERLDVEYRERQRVVGKRSAASD